MIKTLKETNKIHTILTCPGTGGMECESETVTFSPRDILPYSFLTSQQSVCRNFSNADFNWLGLMIRVLLQRYCTTLRVSGYFSGFQTWGWNIISGGLGYLVADPGARQCTTMCRAGMYPPAPCKKFVDSIQAV